MQVRPPSARRKATPGASHADTNTAFQPVVIGTTESDSRRISRRYEHRFPTRHPRHDGKRLPAHLTPIRTPLSNPSSSARRKATPGASHADTNTAFQPVIIGTTESDSRRISRRYEHHFLTRHHRHDGKRLPAHLTPIRTPLSNPSSSARRKATPGASHADTNPVPARTSV